MTLPGVGRKTANVILGVAFNQPTIPVDTHVERISKRLGLAEGNDNVNEVERKLMKLFPIDKWNKLHHQMIFLGRYHCMARNPKCGICELVEICKYTDKRITT